MNPFKFSHQTLTPKQRYGGQVIHSERDQFGLIQVVDSPICRSLHFDTAVKQSRYFFHAPLTLAFEYQQVLEQQLWHHAQQRPLNSLLMLGVGGGSLASKLHIMFPKLQMTLVDLRQSVIDIAHDFFHLPMHPHIQTLSEDAAVFMQAPPQRYDAIIVDLFDAQGMPEVFTQPVFLQQLIHASALPGLLLINLWQSTPEPTLRVIQHMETFGNITLLPIHSSKNLILQYRPVAQ